MVMELVRFDLLAPDFEAIEMPSGNRIDDLPESVFYRGVLTDDANSVVIISVTGDEVSGLISKSDQSGNLNLVHLEGGDYLLYNDIQIKDKFDDIDCETISPEGTTPSPSLPEDITTTGSQKVFGCFGIHLDIGHQIFDEQGSSSAAISLWNNNNTPIDGCGTNSCGITASIPSDGGTIMSYCALTDVGVNLSKGFGPQPGDHIRAYAGSVNCNTYRGCEAYSSCDVAFTNAGCRTTTIYWNNNGNLTSYRNLAPGETFSKNTGCSDVNVWTRINGNWRYYTKMSPNETYQPNSEEGVSWEFWYNTTERAAYYTADCSGNLNYDIETRGCSTSGPLDDGVYAIYARHSNQVISTASSGINNGTNIIQYPFGEHFGQRWRLSHLGNDVYRITNEHSNRVMDVAGVSQNSGANVHIWSDFNADNQKWKLKNIGGGYFNLIAEHSGKCLNVSGGSTAYFTSLIQWDCLNGSTNDDFRFTPLSESLVSELPPLTEPSELEVLPNPATDEVSINFVLAKEYKNGTVTLRDIQGRVVENLPFQGFAGKHELRLDIRNFKSGIYIISLRTEELILNKRLVIRQ